MGLLQRLEVEHLAILDRVELEFGPGLNVLTGETGAGKSLLLDAVQLALGARGDPGLIRQGESRLRVSLLFAAEPSVSAALAPLGVEPEDGAVLLEREVVRDGRSTCRLNGRLTTAAILREVGAALLSLLGQGEGHRFAQPSAQLEFLDAYAAAQGLRRQVAAAHGAWQAAQARLAALGGDAAERLRRQEALEFAVAEIDAVGPDADEEERLALRRRQIAAAGRLLAAAEAGLQALWEGESAARDRLGEAVRHVGAAAQEDSQVAEAAALLEQAAITVDEAARALRRYRDAVQFEPDEAERLEQRWTLLQRLKRKYGPTLTEVLAYRARAAGELAALEGAAAAAARLTGEISACAQTLGALAGRLGQARRAAAVRLAAEVAAAVTELGMPGARLEVELLTRPDAAGVPVGGEQLACGERGAETVRLNWAANPGEPGQPLGRAASGGELARLLLCLHALRAEGDSVGTLVFDEIDAGIGGRAAAAVAQRLQALGAARQVLCVTHLALIAAAADRHFVIDKLERAGRTLTQVRPAGGEARILEIARMLDGGRAPTSREHALEMLARFARPAV